MGEHQVRVRVKDPCDVHLVSYVMTHMRWETSQVWGAATRLVRSDFDAQALQMGCERQIGWPLSDERCANINGHLPPSSAPRILPEG